MKNKFNRHFSSELFSLSTATLNVMAGYQLLSEWMSLNETITCVSKTNCLAFWGQNVTFLVLCFSTITTGLSYFFFYQLHQWGGERECRSSHDTLMFTGLLNYLFILSAEDNHNCRPSFPQL